MSGTVTVERAVIAALTGVVLTGLGFVLFGGEQDWSKERSGMVVRIQAVEDAAASNAEAIGSLRGDMGRLGEKVTELRVELAGSSEGLRRDVETMVYQLTVTREALAEFAKAAEKR